MAQVHFVRGEHAEAKRWADVSLEIARVIGSGTSLRLAAAVASFGLVFMGAIVAPVFLVPALALILLAEIWLDARPRRATRCVPSNRPLNRLSPELAEQW